MAKSDWLKHLTKTYKTLKQSNPEAKLKDAMRAASKTFKKVSSVIDSVIPAKKSTRHRRRGKKSRKNKSKKVRGGEQSEEHLKEELNGGENSEEHLKEELNGGEYDLEKDLKE